jgi:aspartyl-tRNA(Asn)/glutamyl-tRNA(Gln) amidotransferase subunit B
MNSKYEPVMGLEVHVELNTRTKMFCACSANYFGQAPNSHTCPVCLGLPGALPLPNYEAVEKCTKIGLALNCSVTYGKNSLFERKNYFYPDLAKGYQISQLRWPFCTNGWIDVEGEEGKVSRIRINRVHQEEDTGKLTHVGGQTLIDFNRSSVPLVEIVTEPDFTDTTQIKDYAKKLQQIFRYLGVSNADMERGDMRLEANISVREVGDKELPPYRVELKNINSFRFMQQAVEYEIKRQIEAKEKGEPLYQETRGWNETKRETYLQRSKEEANDYRYFPDPDIPTMKLVAPDPKCLDEDFIPELPEQKIAKFVALGISLQNSKVLSETRELAEFVEKVLEEAKKEGIEAREVSNVMVNRKLGIETDPKEIISQIKLKNDGMVDDKAELEKVAGEVIKENNELVESYKAGKTAVIQVLIGQMMKKTSGKANAGKAKEILEKLLSS